MPDPDTTSDITNRLASVLHDLWRAEATRAGWNHGQAFDPKRKLHDSLVPYEQLPEEDRVQLQLAIECQEIEPRLVRFISREPMRFFARGPARPFTRGELRAGMCVRYVHEPDTEGQIESWTSGPDGRPDVIAVRWSDGEVVSYANQPKLCTCDLARENGPHGAVNADSHLSKIAGAGVPINLRPTGAPVFHFDWGAEGVRDVA
jgi:hypothetical protein